MRKSFLAQCSSGCEIVEFVRDSEDGNEEIYINFYINAFYARQKPGWTALVDRLKMIWNILRGKDYLFFELNLFQEDVEKFKVDMQEFIQ